MSEKEHTYSPIGIAKLPERAAALHPVSGDVVIIERGENAYRPITKTGLGAVSAKEFNERNNVTPQQAAAMLAGSMFGYDVPGADPDTYSLEQANKIAYGIGATARPYSTKDRRRGR